MAFTRCTIIVTTFALSALTGCAEILRAEFNLGAGETLESGPLPGLPPGDSAAVTGEIIAAGSGVSLFLAPGGPIPSLDLITGGKPHNTTDYWITFLGVKPTVEQTPVLALDTIDEQGRVACRLEMSSGEFRLVGGDGSAVIGEYTGAADVHQVLMRLDKTGDRCFIRINQVAQDATSPDAEPTMPVITADAPFQDPAFDELDVVRFAWEQVETSDADQYFLDDVVVSKRNGE